MQSRTALLRAVFTVALASALAACAPLPEQRGSGRAQPLVYPPPPDEPRFHFERTVYSSADVIPDTSEARVRRALTGEATAGTPLAKPYAVAVHKGRMFLSDSVERFVKVFDMPRGRFFTIGEKDPGMMKKPLGIDVDNDGTLYVSDNGDSTIKVYDRDGRHLRTLGGPKLFDRLASVTVEPGGDRLYAVDIGGVSSDNHRVRVLDAKSGELLFDIGKRGSGPGEFNLPRDVAVGRNGQLYVVDGGNFRVQVFERDGRYLHSFGAVGRQLGNFARPKEVATDPDGNVYVVDTAFGNFQVFTPEGELLMFVGTRSERDGPARYMLPSGVYVDEDGRVYMVDQWFRKVDVYRPARLKPEEGYFVRPAAARQ